jgi:hypothetical protein
MGRRRGGNEPFVNKASDQGRETSRDVAKLMIDKKGSTGGKKRKYNRPDYTVQESKIFLPEKSVGSQASW